MYTLTIEAVIRSRHGTSAVFAVIPDSNQFFSGIFCTQVRTKMYSREITRARTGFGVVLSDDSTAAFRLKLVHDNITS